MKSTLLLGAVLLLWSCASTNPPPSLPVEKRPLPEAVVNPPSVSTEGASTALLQTFLNATQTVLIDLLQNFHNDSQQELRTLLESRKNSPQPTEAAAPSR